MREESVKIRWRIAALRIRSLLRIANRADQMMTRTLPGLRRRPRPQKHTAMIESLEPRQLLSFGLTTTSSSYTIDTGAQLVFSISRTAGSGSVGDLTSMLYSGTQLEAPFSDTNRYSHYESGLSSSCVVTATVDPNGQWILIACNDTGSSGVGVIQYYLARNGYNNIYMATYSAGPDAPSPGEMRFITYTNHSVLVNAPAPSNNTGNTGAIESSDVFGYANGTTSSKYYGEYRAIDTQTYGVTGGGYGVFMNIGNRETSSGGPFFKDIDYQTTDADSTELYNYAFSGHSQTENFRPGLKGPYALEFTTGATPAAPDYTFIDTLGIGNYITGYTGASGRGTLVGTASGVPSTLQETVGLSNATDQYWTLPNTTTGAYTITGILPGTYTETIYQGELAVGTQTVTIAAGQTTACNITDTWYTPPAANTVFLIGTWDGTPLGFLNSNLITDMHPTDVRMSPWATSSSGLTNFIVGTTPEDDFPMAEWHTETGTTQNGVTTYEDTDNRITFTLTAAQAATAQTLRIGTTRTYYGRPTISVNSGAYSSPAPTETAEPASRGLTTGNWRGNNATYSFNIPASALVAGTNTIDIYCTSGSTGTIYSGYQIYDAIDLVNTSSITNAPVVTTLSVSPANKTLNANAQQTYTASAYDQFGNPIAANISWSTTLGTIDNTGSYVAPATAGSGTITATSGTVSASTNVTVLYIPAWLSPSSQATWNTSTHVLTVTGAASIIADPGTDEPIVQASGSAAVLTINPASGTNIHLGGLSLTNGASAVVTSLGSARSLTNYHLLIIGTPGATTAPTYTIDSTSTLDLADNDMAILYGSGTSPLLTVQSELDRAYDSGSWAGPGLTSSIAKTSGGVTALGYGEASTLGLTSFDGLTLGGDAVLVKYTLIGDANLDGTVNVADYNEVVSNFNATGDSWTSGSFDYSGNVSLGDLNDVIKNFNLTLADELPGGAGGSASTAPTGSKASRRQVTARAQPLQHPRASGN